MGGSEQSRLKPHQEFTSGQFRRRYCLKPLINPIHRPDFFYRFRLEIALPRMFLNPSRPSLSYMRTQRTSEQIRSVAGDRTGFLAGFYLHWVADPTFLLATHASIQSLIEFYLAITLTRTLFYYPYCTPRFHHHLRKVTGEFVCLFYLPGNCSFI